MTYSGIPPGNGRVPGRGPEVTGHRIIELELPLINQLEHQGGEQGFADAAGMEHCPGHPWHPASRSADPVATTTVDPSANQAPATAPENRLSDRNL